MEKKFIRSMPDFITWIDDHGYVWPLRTSGEGLDSNSDCVLMWISW